MKIKTIYFLGFVEFLILFSTLLFFLLSSQKSLNYVIEKVTSSYGLEYSKLEGNLLTNITLKDVRYKEKVLTEIAHLDINFKALLTAQIKVDVLTLEKVDLSVLEQLIKDEFEKKQEINKSNVLPPISITSLFFSTKPYNKHDINMDEFKFTANDIKGNLTNLEIGGFSLYTENDYTNITADGTLKNKILDFNHLWITNIDLEKIEEFYVTKIKNQESNESKTKKEKNFSNLISLLKIKDFQTNIKPYNYHKYDIKKLKIKALELKTDFKVFSASQTFITSKTNMWDLSSQGKLVDSTLISSVEVILNDKYFKKFIPFFDHNKIKPINLSLEVNKDGLSSTVYLQSSNLLSGNLKDLNLKVENAKADVALSFHPVYLDVQIDGNLSTKYNKSIALKSSLLYDHNFSYTGNLKFDNLQNLDKNIIKLMQNNNIDFYGDTHKIGAKLENRNLTAEYISKIYEKGVLEIKSNSININEYISALPQELATLKGSIKAQVPIDFHNITKLDADIEIDSNAISAKGNLSYVDGFMLNADLLLAKNSILQNFDKNIKLKSFFPIKVKTSFTTQNIDANIMHKDFLSFIQYDLNSKALDATLTIADEKFTLKGNLNKKLYLKLSTNSLKTFQEKALQFYNFTKEPIDGEVEVVCAYDDKKGFDFHVASRWFVYEYQENKFLFAEKIKFNLTKKEEFYKLQYYYFSIYLDYDRVFLANEPSTFIFKDKKIEIKNLLINNKANLTGNYDFKKSSGIFNLDTKKYHYKGKEGDINFNAKIKATLKPESTNIEGAVDILNGVITYESKKEYFVQDDDIIIIQKENELKALKKENNLIVDISLHSNNPILYKVDNTQIELKLDLQLWKERQKEFELLGLVKLIKGTHIESKKEFKIENGEIIFAGPIINPFLNINLEHESDPYLIDININGLLDSPIINFSSTPFLTQSDILSILLFNSTTEELLSNEGDSSKAAISMFGNVFAKELVENFGIKLDKLVLTTNNEGKFGLEVGKKISRKMTIIYINDIVQTIKIKYQHSKQFETDFTFSPNASGIDFLYKNEY